MKLNKSRNLSKVFSDISSLEVTIDELRIKVDNEYRFVIVMYIMFSVWVILTVSASVLTYISVPQYRTEIQVLVGLAFVFESISRRLESIDIKLSSYELRECEDRLDVLKKKTSLDGRAMNLSRIFDEKDRIDESVSRLTKKSTLQYKLESVMLFTFILWIITLFITFIITFYDIDNIYTKVVISISFVTETISRQIEQMDIRTTKYELELAKTRQDDFNAMIKL